MLDGITFGSMEGNAISFRILLNLCWMLLLKKTKETSEARYTHKWFAYSEWDAFKIISSSFITGL